jgi:hypothetical protein
MGRIENVCDLIESHEKRVTEFFNNTEASAGKSPLSAVETELPRSIKLLEDIFEVFPLSGDG